MNVNGPALRKLTAAIFVAAGCSQDEADCVADHLVEANLAGHDSHGVIRIATYVRWLGEEKVMAGAQMETVFDSDVIAVLDGNMGLGQVMARRAMCLGIEKCDGAGVAVIALRNCAHMGRIGHWAEMAAASGYVSLHFVNTNGLGVLVAPTGGISRRLSANPVAVGIPVAGSEPIIYDISTSTVAEGKVRVALNQGTTVPDGCLIDAEGRPTNDPKVFYGNGSPPGAILPFGGHKGYGLGIVADILAGALTGGGCSAPGATRLEQSMLTILLKPELFAGDDAFAAEVKRFVAFVKSSERVSPDSEILMPGEIEQNTRAARRAEGIPLDETTWGQIVEVCNALDVTQSLVSAAAQC
ncbi:MAG: malate/lactate/ureidoglycolate dehydrogenase [Planctomycetes bacterium]|nr:malate/lactate/ureidoglycolate dehydrogenase [Planctomycetota bacterium]